MKVLVAGAGWAGLAAAIELTKAGHAITVVEASRTVGGRARALEVQLPNGEKTTLDNGQHILIGAYSETLRLMQEVGVNLQEALHRIPLTLRFPNGDALVLPDWKNPPIKGLDVAWGIIQARGWSWMDKLSLLRAAAMWRLKGFECAPHESVATLCLRLTAPVMQMLIEPLCVSALNTPADRASGQVFLRILRDSLFAAPPAGLQMASSNLLLPRIDLGALFPQAAAAWLAERGCQVITGQRLTSFESLSKDKHSAHILCRLDADIDQKFDALVLATPPYETARLAQAAGRTQWASITQALQHEAIASVYATAPDSSQGARLPEPMMALKSSASQPAQFVFDRGQLTGQLGLLAFVVSASNGSAQEIERQVIAQGREQLNLPQLQAIKTIVDKRATFACTPGLQRPPMKLAPRVLACGDYVHGPYPSTLEGAVRSGMATAKEISFTLLSATKS
jgi:hydroxysqualene dehydroxylase